MTVGGGGPVETSERFGHAFRHFQVAISAGTQALAWARQEDAPAGAVVVADLEVSPLGFRGRMWHAPQEATLSCALVLRPPVPAEEGDVAWLVGALCALEGAEATTGRQLATWWPNDVVDAATKEPVAGVKAEVQLGPGKVRSAVVSLRFDLQRLGLGADGQDDLLEAVVASSDRLAEMLSGEEGTAGVAAAYGRRCALLGHRVKIRLLPKGEARGVVGSVDTTGRLVLSPDSEMAERVTIDMVRELQVV